MIIPCKRCGGPVRPEEECERCAPTPRARTLGLWHSTTPRPAEERFWEKVDASGDCWEWMASRNNLGYGSFRGGRGGTCRAHRFAYEALVGPIPSGYQLDHLCRNRRCVNPDHLEAVTSSENLRRSAHPSVRRRHDLHCQRGHAFAGTNLGHDRHGQRYCKECARQRRTR